jgi:hypothetical protein
VDVKFESELSLQKGLEFDTVPIKDLIAQAVRVNVNAKIWKGFDKFLHSFETMFRDNKMILYTLPIFLADVAADISSGGVSDIPLAIAELTQKIHRDLKLDRRDTSIAGMH